MKKVALLLTLASLPFTGMLLKENKPPATPAMEIASSNNLPVIQVANTTLPVETDPEAPAKKKKDKPKAKKRNLFNRVASLRKKVRKEIPLAKKTELTPAELKQLRLAQKLERRKKGAVKSDGPDEFAKFQHLIRTKEGTDISEYEANYKLDELEQAQKSSSARKKAARSSNLAWTERGPANVPGRTRGLLVHPTNPKIWFAGSAGGGVWKTTDGGVTWINKTPNLPNLATTTLAMSPVFPNIIYAGSGEGFYNADAIKGDGIFKSEDGGETWKQLSSTAGKKEFQYVNRIIVDPENANLLIAATQTGDPATTADPNISWIMRSKDGGASWSAVYSSPVRIQQVVASPDNFNTQYATINGLGVIKSKNRGQNWFLSNKGMYPGGRVEMAIAPTKPSRLYASAEGGLSSSTPGSLVSDLYQSDDAGATWTLVIESGNQPTVNWLGGQGWYDNTILAHPFDENTVYLGGVQLWKTTMTTGKGKSPQPVVQVEEVNTQSFLDFTNLGGPYFGGKLVIGNIAASEYISVEIRFGPGESQKAHRFTVGGREAGVPPQDYIYKDYVEVPFEVWDISHNRQLMVSFRDQQEDGQFNLLPLLLPNGTPAIRREYLYIHTVPYAPTPDASIAQNAGHTYKQLYFLWPILKAEATWDPASLPKSKVVIQNEILATKLRVMQNLTDSYGEFGSKNSYVHPDHHALVPIIASAPAKTFQLLNGNDGGVYVSKPDKNPGYNQGDWIFSGNGYNTTQFYGVDKRPGANEYIGGAQDNGTWRSANEENASATSKYIPQLGGDGFEVSWHYFDPNKIIGGSQNNGFGRSLNGGQTWLSGTNGLTERGPFISQIGTSKSNPDILYTTGPSGIWVSDNFAASWKLTPIPNLWGYNSLFSDVKVSLANNQIVWAGNAMSATGRIHVSTDGGRSFTPTRLYPTVTLGNLSGLATHPTQDSTAYALFSFANSPKILRTTDLGQTWEDISGFGTNENSSTGFPDVAVYSLLVMPNNPNKVWVGTEIGLVESTDGGATWALAQNGLPSVSIWELKIVDDQVIVATHGRGIWSVTLPEVAQEIVFVPYITDLRVATNGRLVIASSLRTPYDSTLVYANGTLLGRLGQTMTKDTTIQFAYLEAGLVDVQLKSYKAGKAYVSTTKTIEFFRAEATYSYSNKFNQSSNDFFGTGFSIRKEPQFADGAIHSIHPYTENISYTYQLKTPIIVAKKNATFNYKDVAIVEPGDPGAPFGSAGFYDYVIVEGTKDGINWKQLEDGYNADYAEQWRAAFDEGLPGTDSLYIKHSVNLLETFTPGDTVFFRFRLYSDGAVAGWGWAVDDLAIQENYTGVNKFTLVNANTGKDIKTLANNDTINLVTAGRNLNIRAMSYPDSLGSVVFELDGQVFSTESYPPYALAGDLSPAPGYRSWTPALGTHTLKATPYSAAQGQGIAGEPLTVTFTVIESNVVASLVLLNADTGEDIDTLTNGYVINLKNTGRSLNIRANTLPTEVGSVVFQLDNIKVQTENVLPYALAGDYAPILRYYSWTPSLGTHTLKATPYTQRMGEGGVGIAKQVSFSIVTGEEGVNDEAFISAYPNPGNGKFVVALKTEEEMVATIYVYDFRGNTVYQQKEKLPAGHAEVAIDISTLPKGVYYLKTASDKQAFKSLRILKKQ
jgi:photosystem II stability/assembly factor-like uncharacterized protein